MKKKILQSLAVVGALALSTTAHATTFGIDGGIAAHQTGWIYSSNPNIGYNGKNVHAGGFELTSNQSAPLDDFIAFCIDIQNTFDNKKMYRVEHGGPTALNPAITANIDHVNALFSTSFSGLDLNDKDQSAGFQLALWEVLFEKKNDWDLGKGTFHVTGFGGAVTAAHDMLTATLDFIDNGVKGDNFVNYELTWLQASNGGQNLVTAVAVSPIPLPAAGPMLIFSLAGLGYLARRRKQAEA